MIHAHSRDKGFKDTRLVVWEKIKKRTGKKIDFIDNRPECPKELIYLWDMYSGLLKGCETVGYSELINYQSIRGIKLNFWESEVMIDIDLMRRNND